MLDAESDLVNIIASVQMRSVRLQPPHGSPLLHTVRKDGGGPCCVLIHGFADGGFVWDMLVEALAPHYSLLVVDLRGHGHSGWAPDGRYDIEAYVADLEHIIDHSGLQDLILIGHSLGGQVATHLGARYPQRLRASVLVDFAPLLNSDGMNEAARRIKESLRLYTSVAEYAEWMGETRPLTDPAVLQRIAARALQAVAGGFRPRLDPELLERDAPFDTAEQRRLWQLLSQQTCPTLVVRGAGSAMLSRTTAQTLASTLPDGTLATVKAAGHAVMLDNPTGLREVITGFLLRRVLKCAS